MRTLVHGSEPVAEVVRNDVVEGRHHGSVVALAADGTVEWSVGEVDGRMLARSCLKPLQAVAMRRVGLAVDGELLALVCASHSGEPFHLDGVRRLLEGAGMDEAALQNIADLPLDDVAAQALLRAGGGPSRVAMNCSGKHAGMLATCGAAGWDVDTYRSPVHPLQKAVRATIEELTGQPVGATAVDGCGAPVFATSLVGLARAFAGIALAEDGAEHEVARAIRSYPEWVSGTRRDECDLVSSIPGSIAKAGAEGCYAVALPDGRAVAVKVDDGAPRARRVVMAAALRRIGVTSEPGFDEELFDAAGSVLVFGGGRPVGEIRALV